MLLKKSLVNVNSLLLIVKTAAQIPLGERKPKLSKSPGTLEIRYVIGLCLAVTPENLPSLQGALSPIQHPHDIKVLNPSSALLNPLPALGMLARETALLLGLSRHVKRAKRFLNGSGARCLLPSQGPEALPTEAGGQSCGYITQDVKGRYQ